MNYEEIWKKATKEVAKERDTLIDDIKKLRERNKQLEENDDQLNEIFNYQENKKKELRKEREKLKDRLNQAYEDGYKMEGKYRDMKSERDTLIDDVTWYKAKVSRLEQIRDIKDSALKGAEIKIKTLERDLSDALNGELATYDKSQKYVLKLEHENKRLKRLTHKLTTHRTMWDTLKDWRRDMLEIDKNDTQLIGLGLVMDELEKDNLYKEDAK